MATINLGNLTFTHKGDYASGTAYVKNDVVYYSTNGNAYIAKQATQGNAPTNATYWNQFAQGSGGIWNSGLSLGSANQILQVNSGGTALEFTAKPQGGDNKPMFRACNTSTTLGSGSAGTYYKIPMETEDYDVGGCFNHTSSTATLNGISTPSYSFAPNVAGKYMVGASIRLVGGTINSGFMAIRIEKNGTTNSFYNGFDQDGGYYSMVQVHGVVEMNGTSDYISAHYSVRDNWYEVYNANNTTYFYAYRLID